MRLVKVITGIGFIIGCLLLVAAVGTLECGGSFRGWQVFIGLVLMIPFLFFHDFDGWKVEGSMKEKDFEKQVKDYLKREGCWTLKTWSNGVQREGIPDLLVCCNGFFLGVELKNEKGHPSELQLWNIRQIRNANGIGIVLYPEQFPIFKLLVQALKKDIDKDEHWQWLKGQTKFDVKILKERRKDDVESV